MFRLKMAKDAVVLPVAAFLLFPLVLINPRATERDSGALGN